MQISDFVFIGKLGNKTDVEGFIPFKIYPKFNIEIFSEFKDFFLLFQDHRVRYVTVLDYEERKLKFDDAEITHDAAASSGVMLVLTKDEAIDFMSIEDNLVGFAVMLKDEKIGTITEILPNKAYDLLVVGTPDKREIMIPDVDHFIKDIDEMQKLIFTKHIEELLEL